MSEMGRLLLGLATGMTLGRVLPQEVTVLATLALFALLASAWLVERLAGGDQ